MENRRVTGVVKRWMRDRAYGFIVDADEDFFVHKLDIEGEQDLEPGKTVEFRVIPGRPGHGRRAVDVKVLD